MALVALDLGGVAVTKVDLGDLRDLGAVGIKTIKFDDNHVYAIRPGFSEFVEDLTENGATVVYWSTMKKNNVGRLVDRLSPKSSLKYLHQDTKHACVKTHSDTDPHFYRKPVRRLLRKHPNIREENFRMIDDNLAVVDLSGLSEDTEVLSLWSHWSSRDITDLLYAYEDQEDAKIAHIKKMATSHYKDMLTWAASAQASPADP
jgi:hypothetical protein